MWSHSWHFHLFVFHDSKLDWVTILSYLPHDVFDDGDGVFDDDDDYVDDCDGASDIDLNHLKAKQKQK